MTTSTGLEEQLPRTGQSISITCSRSRCLVTTSTGLEEQLPHTGQSISNTRSPSPCLVITSTGRTGGATPSYRSVNLQRTTCTQNFNRHQGMTLATGPLARRRFSAAGPVGPQACIFYWPDGPLGNRSGHRWVWRTLARRCWWLCLQSPRKQQTVTSVLMGICHHGVAVRGFVWLWTLMNSLPSQLYGCLIRRLDSSALCIQQSKHCFSGCIPLSKSVSVQVTIHNASS